MSVTTLRSRAILAGIIGLAALIATVWAVRVPLYQQSDERAHTDYVFALFDAGRPFVVHDGRPGIDVTPETRYLSHAIGYQAMRYNPYARVPSGYGTAAFRTRLDRGAPPPTHVPPRDGATLPYVMYLYPTAYYAFESVVLGLAYRAGHSLWTGFLAMRIANVALLAGTVFLAYHTLRAYRFDRVRARLATLAIAIFPLTSSIGGYVQPDNATTFFIALACYAGARRRYESTRRTYVAATVALCGLFAVKLHFATATWIATVPLFLWIPRPRDARAFVRRLVPIALLPLVVAYATNVWLNPVGALESPKSIVHHNQTAEPSMPLSPHRAFELTTDAVDGMIRGSAFKGFWLGFGFRGGSIFGRTSLGAIFGVLTVVGFGAFVAGEVAIARRIARVARRRSFGCAARLALAGHATNVYVTATSMLVVLHVVTNGELELEGRYWYPLLLPLAVVALRVPSRTFALPARRRFTSIAAGVMACYAAFAAVIAMRAMNDDFYRPLGAPRFETVAGIAAVRDAFGPLRSDDDHYVARTSNLRIDGYAVDMLTGFPARDLYAEIDRAKCIPATRTGLPSPSLQRIFNDDLLSHAGFSIEVPREALLPGDHVLRFFVRSRGRRTIAFRSPLEIRIAPSRDVATRRR